MEVVLSDPNCVTLDESRLFDLKLIIRKKDAFPDSLVEGEGTSDSAFAEARF